MSTRSVWSFLIALAIAFVSLAAENAANTKAIRIALVGDSTVASYAKPPEDRPDLTGWGQVFGEFFNDKVTVLNHAQSGASSKSFIREGLWQKVLEAKGDYVFIQFGHNDCPGKGDRSTDPNTDFQDYLRQYIDEARAAGAKPILVTPVARRMFVEGKIHTTLQPYADAMLKVGKEKDAAGDRPARGQHGTVRPPGRPGQRGPDGLGQRPHALLPQGSHAVARLVADALRTAVPELTPYLKSPEPTATDASWKINTPIVTYWAGPPLTDVVARQMAEGGWNLVWCGEKELDVAQRHGLRAQLQDGLLAPATLDNPAQRAKLDALITRVRNHPALYSYFITDEPSAAAFPALGKLVAYLRQRDPAHLAYINLFPTYASNEQLGTKGDKITAYKDHLRQYIDVVKPSLVSYDHYQFAKSGDNPDYFLNLMMIRRTALEARVPFLNIVQACTWTPSMRVPGPDELRYLIYTTLAYGGQGISYYVYCHPGHTGGIALADGTPTPLYHALKSLNREFVAIAKELQPLRSLAVYHAGMSPPGSEPLPPKAPFRFDPPVAPLAYNPPERVRGFLLGYFGTDDKPSHVVAVNLDYKAEATVVLVGPGSLEAFDAKSGTWSAASGARLELRLPPGGGKLVRVAK